MSKKLKIALKRNSGHQSEQGFALPMAIGMGMVMLLVGTTMMIRSQGDQMTASAQKATGGSLNVAEVGITRTQALLKQYPLLAAKNATSWNTTTDTTKSTCNGTNVVTGSNETEEEATLITRSNSAQWVNVTSGNPNAGEFRVVSYLPNTPTAGLGTLIVEGRTRSEGGAATAAASNSISAVSVQIPVVQSSNDILGVRVRRNTGAGDPIDVSTFGTVNANVRVEGCSFDSNKIGTNRLEKNPYTQNNTTANVKSIWDNSTPSIGSNPAPFPTLPSVPAGLQALARYRLPPIDASNCYIVLPRIARANGARGTSCTNQDKFGVPLTTTFGTTAGGAPAVGFDIAAGGVYSYLVNSTTSSTAITNNGSPGGDSIKLSNASLVIDPPAGTKVVLYVRGNILTTGTSASGAPSTTCPGPGTSTVTVTTYLNRGAPSNLEIYGANGTDASYGTGYVSQQINVSGNTLISSFIYAPEAIVDISQGQIRGSVWSKIFKSSNSSGCRVAMIQQDIGNISPRVILSSATGVIQSWQRRGG